MAVDASTEKRAHQNLCADVETAHSWQQMQAKCYVRDSRHAMLAKHLAVHLSNHVVPRVVCKSIYILSTVVNDKCSGKKLSAMSGSFNSSRAMYLSQYKTDFCQSRYNLPCSTR